MEKITPEYDFSIIRKELLEDLKQYNNNQIKEKYHLTNKDLKIFKKTIE